MRRETEQLILYGALALGAYFLFRKFSSLATGASASLTSAGNSVGSAVYNFLNPSPAPITAAAPQNIPPGSVTTPGQVFYTVVFSDGSKHAVDAASVAADGTFTYNGTDYTLAQGIAANAAIPTSSIVSGN
jgi:glutamine cyclotransferase